MTIGSVAIGEALLLLKIGFLLLLYLFIWRVVRTASRDLRGGASQESMILAPRVLGEVLLQLELQRVLVGLELAAVVRGEVDRVLVRDVHARDRDRAVVVHLLDELPGELDRLDVRPEGAAEHALEEGLQLRLDRPQDTHAAGVYPGEPV